MDGVLTDGVLTSLLITGVLIEEVMAMLTWYFGVFTELGFVLHFSNVHVCTVCKPTWKVREAPLLMSNSTHSSLSAMTLYMTAVRPCSSTLSTATVCQYRHER